MKMRCPHCGVRGSVDDGYVGRTLSCPKCSEKFKAAPEAQLDQPLASGEEQRPVDQRQDIAEKDVAEFPGEAVDIEPENSAQPDGLVLDEQFLELVEEAEPNSRMSDASVFDEDDRSWHNPAEQGGVVRQDRKAEPAGVDELQKKGDLPIIDSLKEAWYQTKGVKGQIWLAIFVNVLLLLAIDFLLNGLLWLIPEGNFNIAISVIGQIASGVVSTILTAGLIYMGVKRLKEGAVRWQDLFSGFEVAGKITVTWLLSLILLLIGYLLLVLPGIYLTVGYGLALPLVVDKKLSPWQALETSRKAIHKVWWKFLALMLLLTLFTFLAAIPLGIGLIWVVPMGVVLFGVIYKRIIPEDIVAE